ncbi:MAG: tetratricopeptide repeat protein, partial [Candidatus Lokiarchaeota archaeon]
MVDIECKLCNKIIKFDENSPDTYLSKTESGNAMIGKLFTFRVSHKLEDNIQHINVVVIDQNGEYRAHKDYYEEVTEKGSTDLWDKLVRQFPIELRPYLNLASNDDKILLSTNLEEPFNKSIEEWYYSFKDLKEKYPMNRLINLFSVRWNFIIGKHKELLNEDILPNPWSFPQYLRLKARFSPSPDLIDKINEIDTNNLPILIQIETKVAKSEIYLRLGRTDLLESLYEEIYEKWDRESSIETKTGLMLVQAYYSFGLCTLGKIKKALNLVEPSFNFGEILENREIISIAGNFFAAILQAGGELDKALEIYNIVLETSKEIGDERMQAVILTNISIIESKQGLYDKALKRQKSILKLPIVQEEYYLKSSLQGIIGETLFIAERYEESIELCKNILSEEHVSTYYKSQALSTLK